MQLLWGGNFGMKQWRLQARYKLAMFRAVAAEHHSFQYAPSKAPPPLSCATIGSSSSSSPKTMGDSLRRKKSLGGDKKTNFLLGQKPGGPSASLEIASDSAAKGK